MAPSGSATGAAIIALIERWYSGPSLPSSTQNDVPPNSWANNQDLYSSVVARSCRTCHVARPDFLDWDSFTNFDNYKPSTRSRVFGANNLTPLPVSMLEAPGTIMPHARRTFERFWLSTSPAQPEILRDYLLSQGVQ